MYGNTIYDKLNRLKQNTKFLMVCVIIHWVGKSMFLEISHSKNNFVTGKFNANINDSANEFLHKIMLYLLGT